MNFDSYSEAANAITKRLNNMVPDVGIVAGTGLKALGSIIEEPIIIKYSDIPNFPKIISWILYNQ